ncbi:MAG: glycosyltransferase family 2 protein [Deltaproteobacteria bacterium]|nr:glycosyltransferase family 2 protein [Deltaproteobacteria bacterium]MBW2139686.1 glycosyltransferase family 2 protein [Deltaproteobacteria bacterium]
MKPGMTVLIPVLNEGDIIKANTERLLAYCRKLSQPFEIIIVSNGSTDQTNELGRKLGRDLDEIHFLEIPEKGVGRAFTIGVKQANFDRIISVDMDLSIDLGFINQALDLLQENHIVVGSKKMGSQNRTLWRMAGSRVFILTVRALIGLPFEDYSIAAKAYRREIIVRYLDRIDYGTSYVLDIIYHALSDGGRAIEVPVYCEDFRPSKFNLFNEALYRFYNVFRLWWNYHLRSSAARHDNQR